MAYACQVGCLSFGSTVHYGPLSVRSAVKLVVCQLGLSVSWVSLLVGSCNCQFSLPLPLIDFRAIHLGTISKIICVLFVGDSAVLEVLVGFFEKILKVLQIIQFTQK